MIQSFIFFLLVTMIKSINFEGIILIF